MSADDPGGFYAKKRSTLGAGLVFTSPGVPMIFSGQEFLEDEWFRDTKPLDWTKLELYRGIARLYRDLMHWRRNTKGLTKGLTGSHTHVTHMNHEGKVLAYRRMWTPEGEGEVLVIANFSHEVLKDYRVGTSAPGRWHVRFNSDAKMYSSEFLDEGDHHFEADGEGYDDLPASLALDLGPYALVILSQGEPDKGGALAV